MSTQNHIRQLEYLFEERFGLIPETVRPLPVSGSDRKYFRMEAKGTVALGVFNPHAEENAAYFSFSKHFMELNLPVPELYAEKPQENIYLVEDLGNETLLDHVLTVRKSGKWSDQLTKLYEKSLSELARLQVLGADNLDWSLCTPMVAFDEVCMKWDLNYFKYYFLKASGVPFDELKLENDFNALVKHLCEVTSGYFLFRDFQARNIMVKGEKVFFIDFQGGRKGPLQYDVASLLYQAKAEIPDEVKEQLITYYKKELEAIRPGITKDFDHYFQSFVLIRALQTLGAYGFRGYFERKPHFLESVPFAIRQLKEITASSGFNVQLPYLFKVLSEMIAQYESKMMLKPKASKLTVKIISFSYKKGIPEDQTGNGGGFLFDCRSVDNPGRLDEFKTQTGRDDAVKIWLKQNSRIESFLSDIEKLVSPSVEEYIRRDFSNLQVGFGCTGGQHRSVYCADRFAEYLQSKYDVNIELIHREQQGNPGFE